MGDTDIYKKQNFGNRMGLGRKCALLVIDFTVGFNDPALFGGGNIDPAIKKTVGLLAEFRKRGLPVAFTRIVYAADGSDAGVFTLKVPSLKTLTADNPAGAIVPELAPRAGELVICKQQASAFFESPLKAWLVHQGADTVIVTGCTTSGCVRASVVDACSANFRPIVVTDCVGDRALGPHEANLFDMGQKYADLMTRDELLAALK